MPSQICLVDQPRVLAEAQQFAELLLDSVNGGASVGFLPPLSEADASAHWRDIAASIAAGGRLMLALYEDGALQGAVQLIPEFRANGNHRAEVAKLLVHSRARRRGFAKQLMEAIEREARKRGLHLLLLDTRKDGEADRLYRAIGYTPYGEVPRYARSGNGELEATVFFYREI